jgi:hypothetical protein
LAVFAEAAQDDQFIILGRDGGGNFTLKQRGTSVYAGFGAREAGKLLKDGQIDHGAANMGRKFQNNAARAVFHGLPRVAISIHLDGTEDWNVRADGEASRGTGLHFQHRAETRP